MDAYNNQQQGHGNLQPHRGTMILVFSIVGFFIPFVFSIIAWVMGSKDLRQMNEGTMDPSGRGLTSAGRIIGIIGFCLSFLSIIIVGVAIAVGITMFDNQAYDSNQQAVAQETNTYGTMVMQWWKSPVSQGGAGQDPANIKEKNILSWLGFDKSTDSILTTDSGAYKVTVVNPDMMIVELQGIGNEQRSGKYPLVTTSIRMVAGSVTSEVGTDDDGRF